MGIFDILNLPQKVFTHDNLLKISSYCKRQCPTLSTVVNNRYKKPVEAQKIAIADASLDSDLPEENLVNKSE